MSKETNGKKIKHLRQQMGLKAKQLSKILGFKQPYYSRVESGQYNNDDALKKVIVLFEKWKKYKIKKLKDEITFWENFKHESFDVDSTEDFFDQVKID